MTTTTPSPAMTLGDYYRSIYLPRHGGQLSAGRRSDIETALHRWGWFCGSSGLTDRTDGPVRDLSLAGVSVASLVAYRDGILGVEVPGRDGRRRTMTAGAVNKDLAAIMQLRCRAVEDGMPHDGGVVRIKRLPIRRESGQLVLSDDDLSALIGVTDSATWPKRSMAFGRECIDPGEWWRLAITLWMTYGMRTEDLATYRADLMSIRWGCVRPPGPTPSDRGVVSSAYGWLAWQPNKTRRIKPYPLVLPLSPTARAAIDRWRGLCPATGDRDLLCPMPRDKGRLYGQWRRLCDAAGCRPKDRFRIGSDGMPVTESREYRIKDLRSTAATRADDHGATQGYAAVGQWVTGHTPRSVFERSYKNHEVPILRTLETMPVPEGFEPPDRSPSLRIVG